VLAALATHRAWFTLVAVGDLCEQGIGAACGIYMPGDGRRSARARPGSVAVTGSCSFSCQGRQLGVQVSDGWTDTEPTLEN
jgi:hypothetical protein